MTIADALRRRTGAAVTTPGAGASVPALRLENVSKAFGRGQDRLVALDRVSLDVAPGEFLCLVGASGCGKSTLLNIMAGLDTPTSGTVQRAAERPALIFQDAALFPWLTAGENVELALRLRGVAGAERRETAERLLDLVQLSGFSTRRPHELSGGMRQRVAIARALAQAPDILLMDEPFGALDAMTRDLLHDELERIWSETAITVVFVTHNVREAVRLGDRVVLLSSRPGRVAWDLTVDVPRPRRIEAPDVSALAAAVGERLSAEVLRRAQR